MALNGETIKARDGNGQVVATGKVHGFSIPVKWADVFPMIEAWVKQLNPDIIVGIGTGPPLEMEKYGCNVMSGGDAVNPATDIRYCGYTKIDPNGPDIRHGSLPFEEMTIACLKAGIPARLGYVGSYSACPTKAPNPTTPPCIDDWANCPNVFPNGRPSASPGSYMCNYMSYGIPMLIEKHAWPAIGGFIHIQTRPEYVVMSRVEQIEALGQNPDPVALEDLLNNSIGSSTTLDQNIEGVRIALQECVRAKAGK
jgi:pyrrolidone-carboxylate peptidase